MAECPDFRPSAPLVMLQARAALLQRVRSFFDTHIFTEVETPLLARETIIDRHLDPIETREPIASPSANADEPTWYLQTSPELHMKRLLAAGAGAIYQITRSFRGGEQGALHNHEFTMVEWYRPGDAMQEGMELLSAFSEAILEQGPAETISYQDAFLRYAGIDPLHSATDALFAHLKERGGTALPVNIAEGSTEERDSLLDLILVELVQPHLGQDRPTILYDYPESQAALAIVRPGTPPLAERFELYSKGVELANGYHELSDPKALAERGRVANQQRITEGKPPLPEPKSLLSAMRHGLPPCSGCAFGLDRALMLTAGVDHINKVIPFPSSRA